MYFTSGSDRAFEQLMQTRPGADHFDSGEAGAPEDCGTCRFYRPHWKYQFCVYEECPYAIVPKTVAVMSSAAAINRPRTLVLVFTIFPPVCANDREVLRCNP